MSQSVDILIKADDKASQKVADAAINVDKSLKRVEQITSSLETPTEKYNKQLAELAELHNAGALSADQFAAAQARITDKIKSSGNAVKDMGGKAKATTEFVGTLAALTGNSELASFASQMAGATEKVGQFSEVAKAGGAGALTFKLGLVGLAAAGGFKIGQFLADIVWQTDEVEKSMKRAKEQAVEFDARIKAMQATIFSNKKEDIELIRDPEEKRAAHKQLLDDLNRDINVVAGNVRKSQKDVDEFADSWKSTFGNKLGVGLEKQLEDDKAKLATLKAQRDEVAKLTSARTLENEQIRLANAAKDKSESYLENLRLEVEYLAATKEEQLKLDAARNTTTEDRGEAERLLKERDALIAKAEAAKELEAAQKKSQEEAAKAAKKAKEDAAKAAQKIEDLISAERERLEIQRLSIEQGKEAARVRELMNKGVDKDTAKQLVAEETSLELLKKQKESKAEPQENLQASESRLLTRGQGNNPMDETNRILRDVHSGIATLVTVNGESLTAQQTTATNSRNSIRVTVPS